MPIKKDKPKPKGKGSLSSKTKSSSKISKEVQKVKSGKGKPLPKKPGKVVIGSRGTPFSGGIPQGSGGQALKITTQDIPAGNSRPVQIKPGPKTIKVLHSDTALGQVTFTLDGILETIDYFPGVPDPVHEYEFTDPININYDFFNIGLEPNPQAVTIEVNDVIQAP